MKVNRWYWIAFMALVLIVLAGLNVASHAQTRDPMQNLPPFMKMCMGQMVTAQQIFLYRDAELTIDEVRSSIDTAMKIVRYRVAQGQSVLRDLDEMSETYHTMANEIYDMTLNDFTTQAHRQEWATSTLNFCVDKLKPKVGDIPSTDEQRRNMFPAPVKKPA